MCKFCENYNFDTVGINLTNELYPHIYLCIGNSKAPIEERFRFCPICGSTIIYRRKSHASMAL